MTDNLPGAAADRWRRHFPALRQRVHGRPLAYLDTAATALRPRAVTAALADFDAGDNANPGASLHTLARRAAARYDAARRSVATFIGATDPAEVVFTRGTTEGINLVAATWAAAHLRAGDNVVVGVAEHASNMAPWQLAARRAGADLRYFAIDDAGEPRLDDLAAKLDARTKVVAVSHVSNVLGMINPVREMCALARRSGRIVVVDGAQSAPHFPVNVHDIGCDFFAFSGHKMLGPMGIGVLWGRRELLEEMPPYQSGSNMAHDVDLDAMHLSEGALKFGAGTPNVSGPVGLAAAIDFLGSLGRDDVWHHEQRITRRMLDRLRGMAGVRLLGSSDASRRISVFSMTLDRVQPSAALEALDRKGIAVRAGDLASLPLLKRLGVVRALRASCYLYTTESEVDRFADALTEVVRA